MSLVGQVTKVGFMEKTATVTVSRFIFHSKTGKVRIILVQPVAVLYRPYFRVMAR